MTTPTRDELLKLAKEAGFDIHPRKGAIRHPDDPMGTDLTKLVARFATMLLSAHQAQAEPAIGWVTEDYKTDKSATTYDSAVADRWRAKGWPVSPIYVAPPSSDQTWNEATEAAAKFVRVECTDGQVIADQILSLARPSQAQEPVDPRFAAAHYGHDLVQATAKPAEELAFRDAMLYGTGAYFQKPDGSREHIPLEQLRIELPVSGAVDEREALRSTLRTTLGRVSSALDVTWWSKPEDRIRHLTDVLVQAKFAIAQALSRAQQAPAVSGIPTEFFDREVLEGVREWIKGEDLTVNIGPVEFGENDTHLESSAGWILRLLDALLAAAPVSEQTTREQSC